MSQLETVHALEEAGQMGAVTLQGPSRPQAQAGRCVGTIPPAVEVAKAGVMIMIQPDGKAWAFST